MLDVIIVGAGVSGCCIARELSRYQVNCLVLDKEEDVCSGTSKANSAIVHAGYDAPHGSLMAELNVKGNQMMGELAKELDFEFSQIGSLVVCYGEEERPALEALYQNGVANGVKDLRIIQREELLVLEPNLGEDAIAALWAPTGGIVCPFGLTMAMAENAYENGVNFQFNTQVIGLKKSSQGWRISTDCGDFEAKMVINAAGVHSDELHNMVSEDTMTILARRGDYVLLDKSTSGYVSHTIFRLPSNLGKGVLVTPTVHGNTIVGPTAIDITDKEGTATTQEGLDFLMSRANATVAGLPLRQVITSFAGLRAHENRHRFFIEEVDGAPGFIDCAAIESPGLSSAPAIGVMVADMIKEKLSLQLDNGFKPTRKGILRPNHLTIPELQALIQKNPTYGTIICRCEMVSEGEILDAIHRPLGARSLDGVKRRTRAGMGRCQAGFCSPRVLEILARELELPYQSVTKSGPGSELILGITKDEL